MTDLNDIAIRVLFTALIAANAFAAGVFYARYFPKRAGRIARYLNRVRKQ
jgi:hypothetical protein